MACAHRAPRRSSGADRVHPTDLRAGQRALVGDGVGRRSPGGTPGAVRRARGGWSRCPVGLRPPLLARPVPRVHDCARRGSNYHRTCPSRNLRHPAAVAQPSSRGQAGGIAADPVPRSVHPRGGRGRPPRASTNRRVRTTTLGAIHSTEESTDLRRSWASGRRADSGSGPGYRQLPEPPSVPVWVGRLLRGRPAAGGGDGRRVDAALPRSRRLPPRPRAPGQGSGQVRPDRRRGHAGHRPVRLRSTTTPTTAYRRGTRWMGSLYGLPAKAFSRHLVSGTAGRGGERRSPPTSGPGPSTWCCT